MVGSSERLTLESLERLVADRIPESLSLEYKASPALQRDDRKVAELRKDVSALANADGGRIVYGVSADNSVPVHLDDGVDPSEVTEDWITQTIHGGVRPRLEGLDVYSLPAAAGRVFYVIDVSKGTTAHMANGGYWKRRGSVSVLMDDYEVRDLMRRADVPNVEIRLRGRPVGRTLYLDVAARNRSAAPADYFLLSLLFESGIRLVQRGEGDIAQVHPGIQASGRLRRVELSDDETDFQEWRWRWWNRMPLFEGDWEEIGSVKIETPYGQHVLWLARAPGMERRGTFRTSNLDPSGIERLHSTWRFLDEEGQTDGG